MYLKMFHTDSGVVLSRERRGNILADVVDPVHGDALSIVFGTIMITQKYIAHILSGAVGERNPRATGIAE